MAANIRMRERATFSEPVNATPRILRARALASTGGI